MVATAVFQDDGKNYSKKKTTRLPNGVAYFCQPDWWWLKLINLIKLI